MVPFHGVAMIPAAEAVKAFAHEHLFGAWPWLDLAVARLVDFLVGPLTGTNTRYYWVFLAEALALVLVAHLLRAGTWRGFRAFCLPRNVITHRSTWVDVQINLANAIFAQGFKLFWRLTAPALAVVLMHAMEAAFGPAPHLWPYTWPALLAVTVLVMVADDLAYYLFHRAAHFIPVLWAFHKVHHTAEALTPLVAGRVHPVEMALSEPVRAAFAAMVLAVALYFFDGEPRLLTLFGISATALVFGGLGNQLLHSEVPISFGPKLDRVLVSPAVHQIHHSRAPRHHNKNMGGLLTVWDWMFGTLVLPVPDETVQFGLDESGQQEHPHVFAAYVRPFWEILPGGVRQTARAVWLRLTPGAGRLSEMEPR
jgi:sterol desaturase/sphingolipid hydroxylase (fatty acid hydroxylase superfamily)